MNSKCKIFLLLLFIAFTSISKSQSKFSTTIIFPPTIALNKISIDYDNGKEIVPFKIVTKNYEIKISGIYYSKYPILTIYNSINDNQVIYAERYFLDKKSSISFYENSKADKNLDSVKLINAIDIKKMGQDSFYSFAKNETNKFEKFLVENAKSLNESDSLMQKSAALDADVKKKKLEFIKINNELYYSLWLFKRDFISNTVYSADSLLKIYNELFSKKYHNSFEEKVILSILYGRINALKGRAAPAFSVIDFKGNTVNLENFKGKYVVLNFWASWCVPCINEMPVIESIYRKYSSEEIAIISISEDVDMSKCLAAIQKNKMDWINIINNTGVVNAFGNNRAIPQVYLIDKTGKIIYSREEDKDFNLKKLVKGIDFLLRHKENK